MKIRTIVTIILMVGVTLLLSSFGGGENSRNPSGAPSGNTGSPGDGQDCQSCHGGSSSTVSGWITSNVPALGYTPGATYTITVSVTGSGNHGFQVSPQNSSGTLLGTLISGTGTKTTGSGKYITHTASSSSNPAIWNFQWTAPTAGTGTVTFYGAFCVTKSDTRVSTLIVNEASTTSTYVFTDNFDRGAVVSPLSNGGTPTMTYTTTSTITPAGTSSTNLNSGTNYNTLLINSTVTPAAGRTYLTGPLSTFSSPYNATLSSNIGTVTWTFNMKTNRSTALSGFDAANYGSAVALVATSSDLMSADGYAVVMVKGTTNNAFKLVRFAGGLDANANLTTIIGPSADLVAMTRWGSIKVVYTPSSNTWELYYRDDGSTTDPTDPTTGTLTQVGSSTVNSTYTSTVMSHFGFFWDHGGTSTPTSNTGRYDNFSVLVTPVLTPTLSVVPSSLNGFYYVAGSGPSPSNSYLLSGVNLTGAPGNITVGCLTNYEVSTDNINFYASVNVGYLTATLASTQIWVRLKAGLPVGNYNSEIVSNAGGGATTQNVTCSGYVIGAPTTYTWTGTTSNDWQIADNWSPARTTPAINDILQFNNGNIYTITNVPAQSIGQLLVSSGTKITLQAAATGNILTLLGYMGDDLSVAGTSELNISGTNTLSISMNTGTTGLISGSMTFSGAAHRLLSPDLASIIFFYGSVFKATTGFTGNAFGTSNLGSVRFYSTSTYIQDAGSNPFGAAAPSSVVIFETGSLYKCTGTAGPSYSGRTYANMEVDQPTYTQNNQGSNPMTCDNYTVTSGIVNWDFSGGVVIKGNISVASGATLTFGNATKVMNLTLSGTATQSISNAGTLTFGPNSTLVINTTTGIVSLASNITVNNLNFVNGIISTGVNTLSLVPGGVVSGAGAGKYVNGTLQMNIPSGTSSTKFEIGDSQKYTPVTTDFNNVSVSGTLTAMTTPSLHPDAETSGIDLSKYLNRYWTLTNSGISFATCNITFSFDPGDVIMGADPEKFIVMKWDPSVWSPTSVSARTSTTTTIEGITSFSDFMAGECLAPNSFDVTGGGSYCAGGTGVPVGLSGSALGVNYQLYIGGTTPVGLPVAGDGGAVSFGNHTVAGTYTVKATRIVSGCQADMNGNAIISIDPLLPVSVTITTASTSFCTGDLKNFQATPENGGLSPSYIWKVNGNISGTEATFSYYPADNDQVTCELTSSATCVSGNPATSNTIIMTMSPDLLTGTVTGNQEICSGSVPSQLTGTLPSNGTNPTFQWQSSTNEVIWTGIYGATTQNYQPEALTVTSYFRLMENAEGTCGGPKETNTVTITVNPLLPVSVQIVADANPVATGTAVTFTATPTHGGTSPVYLWKVNDFEITGESNATYQYVPLNNDQVVCVMTSGIVCPSGNPATSNTVTMKVVPLDAAVSGTVAFGETACYNALQTLTVAYVPNTFLVQDGGVANLNAGKNILFGPGTKVEPGGKMNGKITNYQWCIPNKEVFIASASDDETMVNPLTAKSFFVAYPNPTTGVFNLEFTHDFPAGDIKVEVFGMQGKRVLNATVSAERKHTFSLDGNQAGCYFVRVICNEKTGTIKIIKQ